MNENETVSAEKAKAVRLHRLLKCTFLHIFMLPLRLPSEQERGGQLDHTCLAQNLQVCYNVCMHLPDDVRVNRVAIRRGAD